MMKKRSMTVLSVKTMLSRTIILAFAAAAVLALAPAVSAVSWTGGGDGESWNDENNWEDDTLPDSGSTAIDFTHDGTLTIADGDAAARNFRILSDDLTFNIQDDLDLRHSDGWGDGADSNVAVNHSAGDVYFEYDLVLGTNGGRADYDMTGGSLTWDRGLKIGNADFNYRGGSLGDGSKNVTVDSGGRLTKFGKAPTPSSGDHVEGLVTDNGSFRATIDKTGFDPLKVQYLRRLDAANDSLEVGFDGGIMLNANTQFDVMEISNALSGEDVGSWGNTPTMWTEETTDDHVRITLDEDFNRGSLDAGTVGSSIDERDDIHGFVVLENIGQTDSLRLGLELDDTSAENTNISAFMDDLSDAGYDVSEISEYDLGLTFSDLGTDDLHFAWDLSAYDNSELTLTEITVIPEPSTLVLLGLAGLLLMKRRRL